MADVAALAIRIDSGQALKGARDLDQLTASGQKAERAVDGLRDVMTGLKTVFAGVTVGATITQFFRLADSINNINSRLSLVTKSASEFASVQAEIFSISQRTRVGLEQTSDLFGSLSRSTEQLGVSQQSVLGVTETINKALIVSGASAQSAQAALIQLGQGFAAGALRGEELNSVLEQAPRLARAIADGLGVPIGKLRELGQAGELTGAKVFNALRKSADSIDTEFRRMPLTVQQATTQSENAILSLVGAIDKATGASAAMAQSISGAAGFFAELATEIERASNGDESVGFLALAFQYVTETVKVLYAEIKFVFGAAGREIAAVAAQIVALASLDIDGFRAISDAVKEDAERARRELDAYVASVRVIGRVRFSADDQSDAEARRLGLRAPSQPPKTATPTTGKPKRDPIAAAQLAADLADYKRELAQYTSAFAIAERQIEALRSAGLVNEREFYEARTALVNLNIEAQVRALNQEKARLESQKSTGADQIRNQSRIKDIEAELVRVRSEGAAQVELLGMEQRDAMTQVARAFDDARASATEYLDTIRRQNQRDLDGMGLGNRQREMDARRNERDDQFLSRRQDLDGQLRANEITREQYDAYLAIERDAHQKALAEDERYWAEKLRRQQDWSLGASEAIQNYLDSSADIFSQMERTFTNAFQGMEDALVNFVRTGKLDFKSLADSIVADITRMIVKQQLMAPLVQAMGLNGGSSSGGGWIGTLFGAMFGSGSVNMGTASGADLSMFFAKGGVMTSPGLSAYSGQVVSQPTVFPFAKGIGLMGEAGPEAILPLKRGRDGKLGVESGGSAAPMIVNNNFTIQGQVDRRTEMNIARRAGMAVSNAMSRNG